MTAARWQQIEGLFHAALEREKEARAVFLNEACDADVELRSQVEALLASLAEAGDFIEASPVTAALASEVAANASVGASLIGRCISHYEIQAWLGAGGMGEVYRARDLQLDRQVALKLLPAQFTQDAVQVQRFAREARAASALNHPNIITIHEVGREADTHFIAMEFVAGQTLREKMAHGKIELREALRIAIQIASALDAAHETGIVHRDIKPENVMVRPDGLVKVLDFGLAKPIQAERVTGDLRKPSAVSLQTDPRLLMGTLAYLAPEQARGAKVDQRTDIFSLGVVLYEMLAGRRPFQGDNTAAILAAIQQQPPTPLVMSDAALPAALEQVVRRALAKDRSARYQTAAELRAELQQIAQALAPASTATTRTAWWQSRRAQAALAAGVALLIIFWLLPVIKKSGKRVAPWSDARSLRLTFQGGEELFPSLTADGQSFVYASRAAGNWDLYRQEINSETARNLTGDCAEHDTHPALSPDNRLIAFRSERDGGGIFLMSAQGGPVKKLAPEGNHPAWSPDGREIVYALEPVKYPHHRPLPPDGMWAINVATGARRTISTEDIAMPQWSPHGHRIAYWGQPQNAQQRDIWTIPAQGGAPVAVTNDAALDWNPVWAPDGKHLYFASDRAGTMNLWRVAIDERTGRVLGALEQVTMPSSYSQHFTFSRDGKRLVYVQVDAQKNLLRAAFDPALGLVVGEPSWITQGARWFLDPDISPDGQQLVCTAESEAQEDLVLFKSDGTGGRRLTRDKYRDRGPRWSPDGKQIAFYSDRSGAFEIWLLNDDGSGLRQLTFTAGTNAYLPRWSPDGARLVYNDGALARPFIIEVAKPWAEQTPQPVLAPGEPGRFWVRDWSPDGSKLLGGWRRSIDETVRLAAYSFAARRFTIPTDRVSGNGVWLNDGRRLLALHEGKIFLLDSQTKAMKKVLDAAPYQITALALARDNRLLYYGLEKTEADLRLLELP